MKSLYSPDGPPLWTNIPVLLRDRPQWALADANKRPWRTDGRPAKSNDPSTWQDFWTVIRVAEERGVGFGYMTSKDDGVSCIDLDVKPNSSQEVLDRCQKIIDEIDSYTERSVSGMGFHIWVIGKIGRGRRRDGVEVYSQEHFIVCTGNVYRKFPIFHRQDRLDRLVSEMGETMNAGAVSDELEGDDSCNSAFATELAFEKSWRGDLFRGEWEKVVDQDGNQRYPSQSEADLALVELLLPETDSPRECWNTFLRSRLGQRAKAQRPDYRIRTMAAALKRFTDREARARHGKEIADAFLSTTRPQSNALDERSILELSPEPHAVDSPQAPHVVDWEADDDAEVPDIVEGLVADEEVTLLGGHGGVGKSFLSMQMACSVATGQPVLGRPTRPCKVLYYSAEDGKKRLIRRLRKIASTFGFDAAALRQNLVVLDASEVEPLYGEKHVGGPRGASGSKLTGGTFAFQKLQKYLESHDPQFVIIDGASDTFDGNEIARREVRGFVKLLRQVHPTRKVGVLLLVHIDRSSARGYRSDDEGYAGSAQWHNSSRRRLYLQLKKEKDEEGDVVGEQFLLRVMKNQDGPPPPDIELHRCSQGLWHAEVRREGNLSAFRIAPLQVDHSAQLLALIDSQYKKQIFCSTSLAPQSTSGVYPTLSGHADFPKGLSKKRTAELVRQLEREERLVRSTQKRGNRTKFECWQVAEDVAAPNC